MVSLALNGSNTLTFTLKLEPMDAHVSFFLMVTTLITLLTSSSMHARRTSSSFAIPHTAHMYIKVLMWLFLPFSNTCKFIEECNKYKIETQLAVTKDTFLGVLGRAYVKAVTPPIVKSAFHKTGIWHAAPSHCLYSCAYSNRLRRKSPTSPSIIFLSTGHLLQP